MSCVLRLPLHVGMDGHTGRMQQRTHSEAASPILGPRLSAWLDAISVQHSVK